MEDVEKEEKMTDEARINSEYYLGKLDMHFGPPQTVPLEPKVRSRAFLSE